MKIVVTGKGGAGKTTVSGTLSRLLARQGHTVVAVDCDPSPNLAITLGVPVAEMESVPAVLNALIASGHTHHDPKPDPEDLLARFGVDTPDGVRLVVAGLIERVPDACMCCGSHATTRALFSDLSAEGRFVIADLEAGLNDLLWTKPTEGDAVVAVADPSAKAVEIARRACRIAETLGVGRILAVANRGNDSDAERLAAAVGAGVEVLTVPVDEAVDRADHLGVAPYDLDSGSPAIRAIGELADRLTRLSAPI